MSEWQDCAGGGLDVMLGGVPNVVYGRWNTKTKQVQKSINEGPWKDFEIAETLEDAKEDIKSWIKAS